MTGTKEGERGGKTGRKEEGATWENGTEGGWEVQCRKGAGGGGEGDRKGGGPSYGARSLDILSIFLVKESARETRRDG